MSDPLEIWSFSFDSGNCLSLRYKKNLFCGEQNTQIAEMLFGDDDSKAIVMGLTGVDGSGSFLGSQVSTQSSMHLRTEFLLKKK